MALNNTQGLICHITTTNIADDLTKVRNPLSP